MRVCSSEPTEVLREALCGKMLDLVTRIGIKNGVNYDDLEDCALSFVEHMLPKAGNDLHHMPPPEAWLYRCAENWVRNELRRKRRRQRWESPCLLEEASSFIADDYLPTLLRQEFFDRLSLGVALLSSANQRLFINFYLLDYSCQEIAEATGRTENATRQALWALRVRLRRILEKQGLSETEAGDYQCLMTSSAQGRAF